MAILIVNDNERRAQYIAAAGETVFVYDWEIFTETDLEVYQNEILLTFPTQYTVTNAGITGGGDIILVTPATLDDDIVIVGDLDIDQTADFTNKANFTGQTVQTQFNKLTMIEQELDTKLNQRGLLYNVFAELKPNNEDNVLPILAADQFWQMNATGTGIFAAEFEIDPGANTLRSELISAQSGSDGAKIVGYSSPELGETTVHDQLDILVTESDTRFKNLIIGGDFSTNPAQRGSTFVSPVASGTHVADRFEYVSTNASLQLGTTLPAGGGPTTAQAGIFVAKYLAFVVTNGIIPGINDEMGLFYAVEGYDWTRIFGRSFTLSFWMSSTVGGIYSVSFNSTSETYVSEITQPAGGTWTKHIITVPASSLVGNSTNGRGLVIFITFASGANNQTATLNQWFASGSSLSSTNQVNGVDSSANEISFALFQLEPGTSATGFGVRSFAQELELCQRYYVKTYNTDTSPGSIASQGAIVNTVQNSGLTEIAGQLRFDAPVKLRVSPQISNINAFSPATGASSAMRNATTNADISATVFNNGEITNYVRPSSGGLPSNTVLEGHITIDVEL